MSGTTWSPISMMYRLSMPVFLTSLVLKADALILMAAIVRWGISVAPGDVCTEGRRRTTSQSRAQSKEYRISQPLRPNGAGARMRGAKGKQKKKGNGQERSCSSIE